MISTPDEWDDYRFDLEGFLILKNAVQPELIAEINEKVDEWLALSDAGEEWLGNVHVVKNESTNSHSVSFRNVIEGGSCFEALIDNPNWIEFVKRYVDNHGLHIWMNFLPIIRRGSHVRLHAGGHNKMYRTSFEYHDNKFFCGNLNILLALNDIGPGGWWDTGRSRIP